MTRSGIWARSDKAHIISAEGKRAPVSQWPHAAVETPTNAAASLVFIPFICRHHCSRFPIAIISAQP